MVDWLRRFERSTTKIQRVGHILALEGLIGSRLPLCRSLNPPVSPAVSAVDETAGRQIAVDGRGLCSPSGGLCSPESDRENRAERLLRHHRGDLSRDDQGRSVAKPAVDGRGDGDDVDLTGGQTGQPAPHRPSCTKLATTAFASKRWTTPP
jgi:hypothetical protein